MRRNYPNVNSFLKTAGFLLWNQSNREEGRNLSSIVLGIFIANETSERKREPVKAAGYGAARSLIFPVEERTAQKSKSIKAMIRFP